MTPLAAILAIVGVSLVLVWLVARVEGLAFLGPKSTRGLRASASTYCVDECRVDGRCPMTGSSEPNRECPLWTYINADVATEVHGSPFEAVQV